MIGAAAIAGSRRRLIPYPSFVNLSAYSSAISTTSMTMALPVSIVAGNVLLAVTTIVSTRNPVWPAGWTAIGAGFAAYRIADGSDTAPTVTWEGGSTQAGWISQWRAPGGVGATRDNQAQNGSPATVAAITTTADRSLCLAAIISGSSTIPGVPAGFTDEASASESSPSCAIRFASVEAPASGGSSGDISSDVSSTAVWRALLVELKG